MKSTCLMISFFLLSVNINAVSINERHIIEDVPYVSQSRNDLYCNYACCAMLLQYYGINASLKEVLHNTGIGYSLSSRPRIFPTPSDDFPYPIGFPRHFRCWCGQETSLGEEDAEFLAHLYGLSCEYIYPKIVVDEKKCWSEYWERVKNYVLNDIPVSTNVDFTLLPYYINLFNLSGKAYHFSHNIVIVGFDEMKGVVYYHDPLCKAYTKEEDGKYAEISIDVFRKAVYSVHWCIWNGWEEGYTTLVFKKSGEPMPKEKAFEIAHKRNIERMKGNASAYDKQSCRENFKFFGINALKMLKKDFSLQNFLARLPFLILLKKFYIPLIIQSYDFLIMEKENISLYLKNADLNPVCQHDAVLLDEELECWEEIKELLERLNKTININPLKTIILCIPILENIKENIDKIIEIEEEIIGYEHNYIL